MEKGWGDNRGGTSLLRRAHLRWCGLTGEVEIALFGKQKRKGGDRGEKEKRRENL